MNQLALIAIGDFSGEQFTGHVSRKYVAHPPEPLGRLLATGQQGTQWILVTTSWTGDPAAGLVVGCLGVKGEGRNSNQNSAVKR